MEEARSFSVMEKINLRQAKDDKFKDAILKQIYTGILGGVAVTSLNLGASLGSPIGLAVGGVGALVAGGFALYNLVGVIKSLKERAAINKELKAVERQEQLGGISR